MLIGWLLCGLPVWGSPVRRWLLVLVFLRLWSWCCCGDCGFVRWVCCGLRTMVVGLGLSCVTGVCVVVFLVWGCISLRIWWFCWFLVGWGLPFCGLVCSFWLWLCCFSGLDGSGLVSSGVRLRVWVFCCPGFGLQ